jgi:SAM-dependent methyltransferase
MPIPMAISIECAGTGIKEMAAQAFRTPPMVTRMGDYYRCHYRSYYDATADIDPEPFLGHFARRLAPGDRVLDVGCGSGRDLRWLRRKGMTATGFERSPELADLARRLSGCEVIEGDFTRYDFRPLAVDAVMLCGALVHIPHNRLTDVLDRILAALDPASGRRLVYLSLKEGDGTAVDRRGRRFHFWRDGPLRDLMTACGLHILDFRRSPSADGRGDAWLGYEVYCPLPGA